MNWVLIIALRGAVAGIGSVNTTAMTELQCKASLEVLAPLKSSVGAACVGPNGEVVEMGQ